METMTHGMKFDLIISNPPYAINSVSIHLKILTSVLSLANNICFIHPAGWLNAKFDNNIRTKISKRVNSIELLYGNTIFDISNQTPLVITSITNNNDNIHVIDNVYTNTSYYTDDIFNIHKYSNNIKYVNNIIEKVKNKVSLKTLLIDGRKIVTDSKFFGIPITRGNVASSDFYTIVQKNKTAHFNNTKYFQRFICSTDKELEILYDFFKLKIIRFLLSLHKDGISIRKSEFSYIPIFDFTKSWTDEECARELGITDEELLWMIQQIPNYYPEDEAKYKKLENKLKKNVF